VEVPQMVDACGQGGTVLVNFMSDMFDSKHGSVLFQAWKSLF
jgi:hypothetical protein